MMPPRAGFCCQQASWRELQRTAPLVVTVGLGPFMVVL